MRGLRGYLLQAYAFACRLCAISGVHDAHGGRPSCWRHTSDYTPPYRLTLPPPKHLPTTTAVCAGTLPSISPRLPVTYHQPLPRATLRAPPRRYYGTASCRDGFAPPWPRVALLDACTVPGPGQHHCSVNVRPPVPTLLCMCPTSSDISLYSCLPACYRPLPTPAPPHSHRMPTCIACPPHLPPLPPPQPTFVTPMPAHAYCYNILHTARTPPLPATPLHAPLPHALPVPDSHNLDVRPDVRRCALVLHLPRTRTCTAYHGLRYR